MALTVTTTSPVSGVDVYVYDNLDTADTNPTSIKASGTAPVAGCMQVVGTFGGGTVSLQGSNDNTNWHSLKDLTGITIALTSAGIAEFSTSAVYIRPRITGGTGDDVDVRIALRG